jgi:hypothetical protein
MEYSKKGIIETVSQREEIENLQLRISRDGQTIYKLRKEIERLNQALKSPLHEFVSDPDDKSLKSEYNKLFNYAKASDALHHQTYADQEQTISYLRSTNDKIMKELRMYEQKYSTEHQTSPEDQAFFQEMERRAKQSAESKKLATQAFLKAKADFEDLQKKQDVPPQIETDEEETPKQIAYDLPIPTKDTIEKKGIEKGKQKEDDLKTEPTITIGPLKKKVTFKTPKNDCDIQAHGFHHDAELLSIALCADIPFYSKPIFNLETSESFPVIMEELSHLYYEPNMFGKYDVTRYPEYSSLNKITLSSAIQFLFYAHKKDFRQQFNRVELHNCGLEKQCFFNLLILQGHQSPPQASILSTLASLAALEMTKAMKYAIRDSDKTEFLLSKIKSSQARQKIKDQIPI